VARCRHGCRTQPGRVRGAGGGRRAALKPMRCRWSNCAPRQCRTRCRPEKGAMAAVLGLDAAAVVAPARKAPWGRWSRRSISIRPKQIVIAGHKAAPLSVPPRRPRQAGAKRAVMLPVSAPFHCSLMQPAADACGPPCRTVPLSAPRIPVVNNVDVACLSDPEAIRMRWCGRPQPRCAGSRPCRPCDAGRQSCLSNAVRARCYRAWSSVAPTAWWWCHGDLAGLEAALAAVRGRLRGCRMLKGQIALVTGASRGIGRAIALELGGQGATVIGTATSEAGAADIQKAFDAAGMQGWGAAGTLPTRGLRGADRRDREEIRRGFGAGQQRRHHPRQPCHAHEGRRVGYRHRDQSQGGVPSFEGW
jgi:hypothetical protein